jgi:2',3'-cyclic-nucleotide 2'-phosphodiesterase (5'-nucleotidase family)
MKRIFAFSVLALLVLAACAPTSPPAPSNVQQITIYYTSDEHGYLEPWEEGAYTMGGAANLMARLNEDGYVPADDLLLSGGDMWTGPAISSWFQGASTTEIFNALEYDAAALGNHDFDFGQQVLSARAGEASFPFLAANLTASGTGRVPEYAETYVIQEIGRVQVGIIGLTLRTTPNIVLSSHVEDLVFADYASVLEAVVPEVRAEGADVIVVISHVCPSDLSGLAPMAAELGVSVLAGGHCHRLTTWEREGVSVIGAGSHWEALVRVDLVYDTNIGQVTDQEVEVINVRYQTAGGNPLTPDPVVEEIVAGWSAENEELLGGVIGYTATGIEIDWEMYNLLVDSWLWYYPQASLAISNLGGFRDSISAGEITLGDIVTVFPFENTLVDVELTGEEVLQNLRCCGGAVGGMTVTGGGGSLEVILTDGSALDPSATYHVLVNSYLYQGGDGFHFADQDPEAYDTGIHWREPVVQWLRSQETSAERPVESLLDPTARAPW